jgi:hypothetical protein
LDPPLIFTYPKANNITAIKITIQSGNHPKPININIETNTLKNINNLETPMRDSANEKKLTNPMDTISFPNSVFNGPKNVSNNSTIFIYTSLILL